MPNITLPLTDPRRLADLANLIASLDLWFAGTLRNRLMFDLTGSLAPTLTWDEGFLFPCRFGYMQSLLADVWIIGGNQVPRAISLMEEGWKSRAFDATVRNVNSALERWVDRMISLAPQLPSTAPFPPITIAGHSLGGAIGLCLALRLRQLYPNREIDVTTFGTPKVTGTRPAMIFAGISMVRVVTIGDNIPSFPPPPAQAPELYAAMPEQERINVRLWTHPCDAIMVDTAGTITPRTSDLPFSPITSTSLTSFMLGSSGLYGRNHEISSYFTFLNRAIGAPVVAPPPPPPLPVPALPVPPVVTPPRQVITPAEVIAIRAAVVAFKEGVDRNENQGLAVYSVNQLKLVSDKQGWHLEWMGFRIAFLPTKKKGLACKRGFNHFLKIFQSVGQANSPNFVLALADYLAAAASPNTLSIPRLNDGGVAPADTFPSPMTTTPRPGL